MIRRTSKPKPATVMVTAGDLCEMQRSNRGLTPIEVKAAAKARAAGRELFVLCRSTKTALNAIVSGVPRSEVEAFCLEFMKT